MCISLNSVYVSNINCVEPSQYLDDEPRRDYQILGCTVVQWINSKLEIRETSSYSSQVRNIYLHTNVGMELIYFFFSSNGLISKICTSKTLLSPKIIIKI